MSFFRGLLSWLLSAEGDEPAGLQARFSQALQRDQEGMEIATLPFLLHILDMDGKRRELMAARVPKMKGEENKREEGEEGDTEGDSILHYAARQGYTFWCDALLRRDALLDEPNAHGLTPLFVRWILFSSLPPSSLLSLTLSSVHSSICCLVLSLLSGVGVRQWV